MLEMNEIRDSFPAIGFTPDVLRDDAGESQIPRQVADTMRDDMLTIYVPLGADCNTPSRSPETVERAHEFIELFMNGVGLGKVVLGSSTTALCAMLAERYARAADDRRNEIIVAEPC